MNYLWWHWPIVKDDNKNRLVDLRWYLYLVTGWAYSSRNKMITIEHTTCLQGSNFSHSIFTTYCIRSSTFYLSFPCVRGENSYRRVKIERHFWRDTYGCSEQRVPGLPAPTFQLLLLKNQTEQTHEPRTTCANTSRGCTHKKRWMQSS